MTQITDASQPHETSAFELLSPDPDARLGVVRTLVDHFYDEMDSNAEFAVIRALHPTDLSDSRNKLYKFLAGWLGGPDLYIREYGHPRLRARHMPFPIANRERDQWLVCMAHAMKATGIEGELGERLLVAFYRTADFMRNRAESPNA